MAALPSSRHRVGQTAAVGHSPGTLLTSCSTSTCRSCSSIASHVVAASCATAAPLDYRALQLHLQHSDSSRELPAAHLASREHDACVQLQLRDWLEPLRCCPVHVNAMTQDKWLRTLPAGDMMPASSCSCVAG